MYLGSIYILQKISTGVRRINLYIISMLLYVPFCQAFNYNRQLELCKTSSNLKTDSNSKRLEFWLNFKNYSHFFREYFLETHFNTLQMCLAKSVYKMKRKVVWWEQFRY